MIYSIKTTYAKQWVKNTIKYVCKCGHKFTRLNTSWFTINPFNTKPADQCRKEYTAENKSRVRPCPKCKKDVRPQKS